MVFSFEGKPWCHNRMRQFCSFLLLEDILKYVLGSCLNFVKYNKMSMISYIWRSHGALYLVYVEGMFAMEWIKDELVWVLLPPLIISRWMEIHEYLHKMDYNTRAIMFTHWTTLNEDDSPFRSTQICRNNQLFEFWNFQK